MLRKDGSAQVELTVAVANNAPPYAQAGPDPRTGYFTRWSESAVAVFLPRGVKEATVRRDGKTVTPFVDTAAGRPFLYQNFVFAPGTTRTMTVTYDVPRAAQVRGDGSLVYRLDADPQGMVSPEMMAVEVRLPDGYRVDTGPEGWRSGRRGAIAMSLCLWSRRRTGRSSPSRSEHRGRAGPTRRPGALHLVA